VRVEVFDEIRMSKADNRQKLQTAFSLHQSGNLDEAANIYRQLIKSDPNNFHALHFLGVIEAGAGNYEQAKTFMARSLSIQPPNIQFIENYAGILFQAADYQSALQLCKQGLQLNDNNVSLLYVSAISLFKLNQLQDSLAQFERVLMCQPNHIPALNERGSVLAGMKDYDSALATIDKALALNPQYAEAHLNKGSLYGELERYDQAIAAYDKALTLRPDLADAWFGRGNVFRKLKRHNDALAAFDKALALRPDLANAWLGRGNIFSDINRHNEALTAYDKALALKPDLAEAWLGRGNIFSKLKRHDDALAVYDKALALKPDLAEAWLGRGHVFRNFKRNDGALAAYDKALALKPDFAEAWLSRGYVLSDLRRYDDAFAAFDKALPRLPDLAEAARMHAKMHICNWSNFDTECEHLMSSVRDGLASSPFPLLAIASSPGDLLKSARQHCARDFPPSDKPIWRGEKYSHDRIRVAYLSADFYRHPVAYLIAGVFEQHDKSRFEITGISVGPDDNSEIRQRIKTSFERFIDAATQTDEQIAELVNALEIDILVDLQGLTAGARTSALARRPAPIQVNYLGYPGTMGTPCIDYIFADRILIPQDQHQYYSEKVVYLSDSYQANDTKRRIADAAPTRGDENLPPTGFVFCCFNNSFKITPKFFAVWMRLLKVVPGSVFWCLETNSTARQNLCHAAEESGVSADRLVFAPRKKHKEHLARQRLADLFLDTSPYNAHTTTSDALWAGLPVVTCLGETFPGRVAASLLTAAGLPELITHSLEEYENLALSLAREPTRLASIKQKLARNRDTCPLFNTERITRYIEAAYTTVWERQQRGEAPQSFAVDPID